MVILIVGFVGLVCLHELGHAAMAKAFGYRIQPFARKIVVGIRVYLPDELDPKKDFCMAMAGPFVNLAMFVALFTISWQLSFLSFLMGVLSLIPMKHSDGLRAYKALKEM